MKRRTTEDHYGQRTRDQGADDTPLWTQSIARMSPDQRKAERERWKERLHPIVLELARRRGPEGITASEVLAEALVLGTLTPAPESDPRRYSWIGPWLAQLARDGQLAPKLVRLPDGGTLHVTRKSQRFASKQNANGIYLDPQVAA